MLRVLEEQRFEPVGSNTPVQVDVRVISARRTKDLDELIENGTFRADLFFRLNVIPFQIPPLARAPRRRSRCWSSISTGNFPLRLR